MFQRRLFFLAALLAMLAWPLLARADVVEIKLSSGVVATAEYRTGQAGKPALLLLHGFMQTRDSPPMNRLADALADAGYTVLVPTLSLGVTRRAKSLSCEAVHKHTLEDDMQELSHWVDWLGKRAHRDIVLVGHSSGAKDVLAYAVGKPDARVNKVILVSIAFPHVDHAEYARSRAEKAPGESRAAPLRRFTIAYCKGNYVSSTPAYLSYASWDGDRIVARLNEVKVPAFVIIGDKDAVFLPEWGERLRKTRVPVDVVKGAGHFFDGEHEFELFDRVDAILRGVRR